MQSDENMELNSIQQYEQGEFHQKHIESMNNKQRAEHFELIDFISGIFLRNAIRHGSLNIDGMTDDEAFAAMSDYMKDLTEHSESESINFISDHTTSILKEARELVLRGQYEIAIILYATWLEHWINGLIISLISRRNMSEETKIQIVRDTNFRSKFTWLLELLDAPVIEETYFKAVLRASELRNGYVHYKWCPWPDGDSKSLETELKTAIDNLEPAIEYLLNYEKETLFGDTEEIVRKYIERLKD